MMLVILKVAKFEDLLNKRVAEGVASDPHNFIVYQCLQSQTSKPEVFKSPSHFVCKSLPLLSGWVEETLRIAYTGSSYAHRGRRKDAKLQPCTMMRFDCYVVC